jgi:hypothetical protein
VLTLASEKSLPSTSVNKVVGTSRDTHQMLCPRAPTCLTLARSLVVCSR